MAKVNKLNLSRDEQETHINRMGDSTVWHIYTDDTRMINELERKGYKLTEQGVGYSCKVKISVQSAKKKQMSEAAKEKARQRMKKMWADKKAQQD